MLDVVKRSLALLLALALNADPVLRAAAAAGQIAQVKVQSGQVNLPAYGVSLLAPAGLDSGSLGSSVSLTPALPGVDSVRVQTGAGASPVLPGPAAPAAFAVAPRLSAAAPDLPAAAPGISAVSGKSPSGETPAVTALRDTVQAGIVPQGQSQALDTRTFTAGMSSLFDGTRTRAGADPVQEPAPVPAASGTRLSKWALLRARFGRAEFSPDDYGGPPALKAAQSGPGTRWGRILAGLKTNGGYGLKWGLNMIGIAALLDTVVRPVLQALPWQTFIPGGLLAGFGRIELLTSLGAAGIVEALAASPVHFLLLTLPRLVLFEELHYRLLAFGLAFVGLAALRPVARRAAAVLDEVPDLFGLRSAGQKVLRGIGAVSGKAYSIAASMASFAFATAHFAAWGIHPYVFVFNAVMGLALAHAAYRSRSLTAPFVAHLVFNIIAISAGYMAPMHLLPLAAAAVSAAVTLAGAGFLVTNYLSYRRQAAQGGGWRRWVTIGLILSTLAGAMTASLPGGALDPDPQQPRIVLVEKPGTLTNPAVPVLLVPAGSPAAPAAAKPALSAEQVVRAVKPAVVQILTARGSMGSGFIVRADGLLVTNAHVVDGPGPAVGRTVMVRFANGVQGPAIVVACNAAKDIALLQLPPNPAGWPTVAIGDSRALSEGEPILAIGYPLGMPFSVSRGIVSGLGLRGNGYVTYIQHDAAVNPGNSGGPLFNQRGEVVGINAMIKSQGGGFDGISLAIASADLQKAVARYVSLGTISNPWLGAVFYPADPGLGSGPRVEAVRPGSPAALAGLRAGDTVVAVDGLPLPGEPAQDLVILGALLREKAPQDTVVLQVQRGRGTLTLTITLGAR